jgi:3-hydroxyisobutyrate dehydrogenase-like beta-hydroxyacid dehydrogenase
MCFSANAVWLSSISPVATRAFAAKVEQTGAHYLDAPVPGGEIGAREGRLSIKVGGAEDVLEKSLSLLQKWEKTLPMLAHQVRRQVLQTTFGGAHVRSYHDRFGHR